MRAVLLDSSVWISYFSKQDVHVNSAVKIVENLIRKKMKIIIPCIVLVETLNVLKRKYRFGIDELNGVLHYLLEEIQSQVVWLKTQFLKKGMTAIILKTDLKSSDLYILAVGKCFSVHGFYSFDHQLIFAYKLLYEKKGNYTGKNKKNKSKKTYA